MASSLSAPQVIELSLTQPSELVEPSTAPWWSPERHVGTGIEHLLSVLQARSSRTPVEIEVVLPAEEIEPETAEQLTGALRRYCSSRISANEREVKDTRLHGLEALVFGVPLAVVGLLIVFLAARLVEKHGNPNLVLETIGGVLAWVGLWFPLDTIVFTPLGFARENRRLRALAEAHLTVRARSTPDPTGRP